MNPRFFHIVDNSPFTRHSTIKLSTIWVLQHNKIKNTQNHTFNFFTAHWWWAKYTEKFFHFDKLRLYCNFAEIMFIWRTFLERECLWKCTFLTVISGIPNSYQMLTCCTSDVGKDTPIKYIVAEAQLKYKHTQQTPFLLKICRWKAFWFNIQTS